MIADFVSDAPHLSGGALGVLVGLLLGLAARIGRFCTLGAIEDALYGDSDLRLRMWGVAIAVAIIGSYVLIAQGMLDPATTLYLGQRSPWPAYLIGGLMFGYGMALAGNCGFGALARLGGGDLRSMVLVLVLGVSAYATLSGPGAWLRVWLFPSEPASPPPGIAFDLSALFGIPSSWIGVGTGVGILVLALWPARVRARRPAVAWGAIVGLCVVLAWAGTAWIATQSLGASAPAGPTFVAPLGESILWVMTASALPVSFAIGTVVGVWVGGLIGAATRGYFRWEACDDPTELRRQIFGAVMMGGGGVLASGCSIGQGLSGMSLLSWAAPLTLGSIFAGAAIGLRHLIGGFPWDR